MKLVLGKDAGLPSPRNKGCTLPPAGRPAGGQCLSPGLEGGGSGGHRVSGAHLQPGISAFGGLGDPSPPRCPASFPQPRSCAACPGCRRSGNVTSAWRFHLGVAARLPWHRRRRVGAPEPPPDALTRARRGACGSAPRRRPAQRQVRPRGKLGRQGPAAGVGSAVVSQGSG